MSVIKIRSSVLSSLRTMTSSRQSPSISADKQGLDFVPLLNRPSNRLSTSARPVVQLYFVTISRSSNSRNRSPSHQTPKLVDTHRASPTTSPLMLRMPFESLLHISTPTLVGSISAAMHRPTSMEEGTWKITRPVAASRKSLPSRLFSWQSHTCSRSVVGSKAVR